MPKDEKRLKPRAGRTVGGGRGATGTPRSSTYLRTMLVPWAVSFVLGTLLVSWAAGTDGIIRLVLVVLSSLLPAFAATGVLPPQSLTPRAVVLAVAPPELVRQGLDAIRAWGDGVPAQVLLLAAAIGGAAACFGALLALFAPMRSAS